VYPVVSLSDKFMNTRFGGRQRPHFLIKNWIRLGGEEKAPKQLTADKPAEQIAEAPDKAPEPTSAEAAARTNKRGITRFNIPKVKPPTLAEELNDEIPL
jgi:hypothetical protein